MFKVISAVILFGFSLNAFATEFEAHEKACMEQTEKQVADLAKAGVTLDLQEVLRIYQVCVDEDEGPSYRERCGDRPGGAYDNCTN